MKTRAEILAELRALSRHRRLEALAVACGDALDLWREFRIPGEPIVYHDGVVGERHVVDDTLPERALAAVHAHLRGDAIDPEPLVVDYREPIVAMQDDDLDLPGRIELAYYAIYNLFQVAFDQPHAPSEDIVLSQVASAVDLDLEDWLRDWWMRVWDAWATRPDLDYPPSPLSAAAFEAIAARGPGAGLELVEDGRLRAILLALAGRRSDAIATALEALGPTAPGTTPAALERWLEHHLFLLVPDAIAVAPSETWFALAHGDRLEVRGHDTHDTSRRYVGPIRRVRITHPDRLWVAGDRADAIGPSGTFFDVIELDGARTIAALGPDVLIARGPQLVLFEGRTRDTLPEVRVLGASISDDASIVATFDESTVSIWDREAGSLATHPGEALDVVVGGREVLVRWVDGSASLIATSG